ncbi:CpaF family protein [bacterium]|nr:CpaF family protein [bacterium]
MSLMDRMRSETETQLEGETRTDSRGRAVSVRTDPFGEIKRKIHEEIIEEVDPGLLDNKDNPELVRNTVSSIISDKMSHVDKPLSRGDRELIIKDLLDEVLGYGPIQTLLDDPDVTEVMVNGPFQVYVERKGKLTLSDRIFVDDNHVMRIIEKIVSPIGRRIDESTPMVDARLPDGSRVNAIIPPLSLVGPTITIRKFSADPFLVEDLISFGTLTEEIAEFLRACVEAKLNIIVAGGTGSGKTTTLNVLSSFIPKTDRVVTIEDAAELQLKQDHVVTLESRPPNIEGKGQVTIRDLVKNSLRMRPDRIIIGECRSGEALDMLQAMNTGHDGSLTTAHANSPRDTLSRLETMVLMAGMDLPVRAIREQISSAMDLIVQQNRLRDGTRKIVNITEVVGMEDDKITLQDIFIYKQTGFADDKAIGHHKPTGILPKFIEKFDSMGIEMSREIFFPPEGMNI